jgi:hypothetical protein
MVNEIRIYLEGGGDGSESKADIRKGFGEFLANLRDSARVKRIKWSIIACGSRNSAYDDFLTAQKTHPKAFNFLLVDSEGEILDSSPWEYLRKRDGWRIPLEDDNCHLMVQVFETWLLADIKSLRVFYGNGFMDNAIPKTADIEKIAKEDIYKSLTLATKNTQKGEYQKINHASKLLERIDLAIVRTKASYCNRFCLVIEDKINN